MNNLFKDEAVKARTVDELLLEFSKVEIQVDSSLIKFQGVDNGKDIYNITAPFKDGGQWYIAGRVEARDSEDSEVIFFRRTADGWMAETDIAPLKLQDPFVAVIDGLLVLGGVEVFADQEHPGQLNYRTIFYKGPSIRALNPFAKGPDRMKDIRLCQLPDQRILVMTRPQGDIGGRGQIGYIMIDSLADLNPETIANAVILKNQFIPEEWGGCNELHRLGNGLIGVLGHIAKYDDAGDRHYYATAFCFNAANGTYSPMKIIAVRDNFADGPSKRPDLRDVIFSGGLIRQGRQAQLYCGVSDVEGHVITISDPFLSFEIYKENKEEVK